jgi:hypothetical protein
MKPFQALTLILTIGSLALAQQEMQVERQYPGGTALKNSYFGVQVTVPKGLQGQFLEESGVQLLALGDGQGLGGVLFFQHGVAPAAYQRLMSEPFNLGQATFQPAEQPRTQGTTVSVLMQEQSSGAVVQLLALQGPGGSSVLAMITTAEGTVEALGPASRLVLGSLRFVNSVIAQAPANLKQNWQNQLSGRLLSSSRANNSNSQNGLAASNSETKLALCRDGRYAFQSTSQVSVSAGDFSTFSNDSSQSEGIRKLEFANQNGAIIALTENGLQRRMNVRLSGSSLLLDGKIMSVGASGC